MWRVTFKGVVAHRLRYALTALAVLLGVAFIAGTFVLTDTINSTFNNLYDLHAARALADEFALSDPDERFDLLIGIFIDGLSRRAAQP